MMFACSDEEEAHMANVVVLMTTETKREAQKIVQHLLRQRLIACANILGPVESRFWWREKIDNSIEFLVFMKSDGELFPQLSKTIKQLHSYEVPEILALPIAEGWTPYVEWLNSCLIKAR